MERIPDDDLKKIQEAFTALQTHGTNLKEGVKKYNATLGALWEEINKSQNGYNDALQDLRDCYNDLADRARDYYDDHNNEWTEPKQASYERWIDKLDDVESELDIEIDEPDELGDPDFADWDEENWLPPEAPE